MLSGQSFEKNVEYIFYTYIYELNFVKHNSSKTQQKVTNII